jgi:hypothetical protein
MKDQIEAPPAALAAEILAEAARRQGWALDAAPLFAAMNRSREMAYSFARFALGSLFLLNAGGAFALPTLAQLIGVSLAEHAALAFFAFAAFVAGVACSAAATLLAFLSLLHDSRIFHRHLERVGAAHGFGTEMIAESATELERRLKRDMWMRAGALRFGLLAFAAFVIGAVFATMVLSSPLPGKPLPLRVEAPSAALIVPPLS